MKTRVANEPLADLLDRHTTLGAAELCRVEGERVRCLACGHRCLVGDGLRGICKVRFNDRGEFRVPFGYVAGLQCDPVEKKPFFHVHPGCDALTFGMMGCDLHCSYCQNWLTSQALRDTESVAPIRAFTPEQLVDVARRERARLVVSSYNEPLITAEWAVGVFSAATMAGFDCAFVSNGNATPEVLDYLRPWIVAYKVDLKSFQDARYRSLGGTLDSITQTIRMVHERGIWLEVVTLVIPGFNDDPDELRRAAGFLASVSPDIPWHITAFHKDYRMTDPDATSPDALVRAAEIGVEAGLRYVYAGNLPGKVGPWEDTRCPSCRATVIERHGYLIRAYHLTSEGRCPHCQTQLPGKWASDPAEVRTGTGQAAYRGRLPRPIETASPRLYALTTVDAPPSHEPRGTMSNPSAVAPPLPSLNAMQKEKLVAGAARMLHAAASGGAPSFPTDLAELRACTVAGAFVSLKRGRHLRACCGMLGQPVPLHEALERAVFRTVWEDERFPPVSRGELEYLDMEVWVLHSLRPVRARGEDRHKVIELGKHGVQVVRGQARALFLPSVAIENQWDTRRLLDQVCLKASLPPIAWKDDSTTLLTFEGEVMRGRAGDPDGLSTDGARPVCRPEDLPAFADFSRRELINLLRGATPSYYFWGAPDGNINGLILHLRRPGAAEAYTVSQLSMRPGIPLQSTLFALLRAAAQNLSAQRVQPDVLKNVEVGITVLHEPALHGTVADPHLAGFDPTARAAMVMERNKVGLVFDPSRTAAEVVAESARQAQVRQPSAASVCSLGVLTNVQPVMVSTVPKPVRGGAVRPAACAGTFYDATDEALSATVDRLLEGERRSESWPAAMVPHAGLRFSGHIAAAVLRRLHIPKSVIVIGPKHTQLGVDWAVAPHLTWSLPGMQIGSDWLLARQLSQAIPGLEMDAIAHQREHAIEVELPLLARLSPTTKVVGIAVGQTDLEGCQRFAEGLASVMRERAERPLLLISSDMNHFAPDAENRALDAQALTALDGCDPATVYDTVTRNNISMCGLAPAVIVLETLRLLGAGKKSERVGYATTADVTGDKSRVVGYAGMLFA
ncbi:MAG: AmmeMemoRadiSam system radical SAM enzyme [Gemmataceae bacterium]|nr:AmmeMemoRadiSam system radical SAM enzyme [Gemmataceae bacterium]